MSCWLMKPETRSDCLSLSTSVCLLVASMETTRHARRPISIQFKSKLVASKENIRKWTKHIDISYEARMCLLCSAYLQAKLSVHAATVLSADVQNTVLTAGPLLTCTYLQNCSCSITRSPRDTVQYLRSGYHLMQRREETLAVSITCLGIQDWTTGKLTWVGISVVSVRL